MAPQQARILYIEDDSLSRELVKRILEQHGYGVELADDGLAGVRAVQADAPDMILIDLGIDHLDGYEVATRLRSLPSLEHIPIVALTASTADSERAQALAAGCDGYIEKPIRADELLVHIDAYLSGYREKLTETQQHRHIRAYNQKLVKRLETTVIELDSANQELRKAHRELPATRQNEV